MPKTTKPLTVLVHPDLLDFEGLQLEADKGHVLSSTLGLPEDLARIVWSADLILSPTAWRMSRDLLKYTGGAITAAQLQKYPKKGLIGS